ncbi:MAG: hypothetical protein ABIN05_07940 [candidate division WOR-3 bacterium]
MNERAKELDKNLSLLVHEDNTLGEIVCLDEKNKTLIITVEGNFGYIVLDVKLNDEQFKVLKNSELFDFFYGLNILKKK